MKFDIVDSQIHLFHKMGPEACLFAMDALGISSALLDEAWSVPDGEAGQPVQELSNGVGRPLVLGAHMAAIQHPDRFKFLRRVEHHDPELPAIIRMAGADPHCLALRAECRPRNLPDLAAGAFAPMFKLAAENGLPVFVLTLGDAALLEPSIAEFKDCHFILDHLGLPNGGVRRYGPEETQANWETALGLARHPNVSLKWCHATLAFPGDYPFADARKALRQALDDFGRERVMWASDVTMQRPEITWSDALHYVRDDDLLSEEDRAWVLGRSVLTALRWPTAT